MADGPANRDLLVRWQAGDEAAAQTLVNRYLARLTALARSRLSRRLARRLDPEDVVLSAWRSFFVATGRGRLIVPDDDDLWPVLVTLTLRKLSRQTARHRAARRNVNRDEPFDVASQWMATVADDPGPEEAAALIDELQHMLSQLSPQDREIITRRLRGETSTGISQSLEISSRTVRRAMQRFRDTAAAGDEDASRPLAGIVDTDDIVTPPAPRTLPATLAAPTKVEPTYDFADLLLQKIVGQGGFGKIYRAVDRRRDEIVAVKFLRKPLWRDERAVAALLREHQIVSRLSHESIIRQHGWGRTRAGAVFVVMEWVEGEDLSRRLAHGPLPVNKAVQFARQVATALRHAHQAGVIHGDVTPSNVLVNESGRVVLSDFGFATMLRHEIVPPRGGTPGFLAPEQISEAFGSIGERTDVYGLGSLMYALLTGGAPFEGRDVPDTLAMVLSSRAAPSIQRPPADVPPALITLIDQCLHKEPADRPATIDEVLLEFDSIWKDTPGHVLPG